MKKRFLGLITLLLLSSCSSPSADISSVEKEEGIRVTLVQNDTFTCSEMSKLANEDHTVSFELTFQKGYNYSSCSIERSIYYPRTDTEGTLFLKDIYAPTRVEIETIASDYTVLYDLNGGSFYDNSDRKFYTKSYDMTHKKRANTEVGTDKIYRDGYVLIGWNTEKDGSGTAISLGSKITLTQYHPVLLFAQWKKAEAESSFTYEKNEDGITITGYNGTLSQEDFVVPEKINGAYVTEIAFRAFKNIQAKSLVLPSHMMRIKTAAFSNCSFDNIYFYDALQNVSNSSFYKTPIPTWHINAVMAPRYRDGVESVHFSDSLDNFIVSTYPKNLLFFGGCSMSYGLNSNLMQELVGDDYGCYDLGMIGGTNAIFQFNAISHYIHPGDILIHAPEEGSAYQLMYQTEAEPRMFSNVESDYDLLTYTDMSKLSSAFNAFEGYNIARFALPPQTYDTFQTDYNDRGDIIKSRPSENRNQSFSGGAYTYMPQYVTEDSFDTLTSCYDEITAKQGKVYFSFAPVNFTNLSDQDIDRKVWNTFYDRCKEQLTRHGYTIISKVKDYLLDGRYFYDTDYHLNDDGAKLRTNQLYQDIKSYLTD